MNYSSNAQIKSICYHGRSIMSHCQSLHSKVDVRSANFPRCNNFILDALMGDTIELSFFHSIALEVSISLMGDGDDGPIMIWVMVTTVQ